MLKSKLKNVDAGMSNSWMAGFLLDKSKLSKHEKNNIIATMDTDNERNILKEMEKKIKGVDAIEERKDTHYSQRKEKWREKKIF